jgi:hypothetical protein
VVTQSANEFKFAKNDAQLNSTWQKLFDALEVVDGGRAALGARLAGAEAEPGDYQVRLIVDGKTYTGKIILRADPVLNGRD